MDPASWNRGASLVYAVGVWTMLGAGLYQYTYGKNFPVKKPVEEKDNRHNVKTYESGSWKTTIVYRENLVPLSTRFLNLFGSTKESEKHEEEDLTNSSFPERKD